jgi:hypothetical protein
VKRGLALLPLLALLALAAGCGARDALQLDPVAAAAAKAEEAGSSRVSFEARATAFGADYTLKGDGAFDYDASTGKLELSASPVLPGVDDVRVELRSVDSKLYLRLPAGLNAWLPSAKPWLALGVGKSFDVFGLGALNPSSLQQDPAELLRLLRASSSEVKEAGKAVVRGVETTRYTAKLDLAKAIEANAGSLGLTERERAQLRRAVEQLRTQSRLRTLPVQVFVDSEGMLRRTSLTFTLEAGGEPVSLAQTTDYYDFGVDVDVQAPPASQVADLTG